MGFVTFVGIGEQWGGHEEGVVVEWSGDADQVTVSGADVAEALAEARRQFPDGEIRVVRAARLRRGGVGGFFAKDLGVELVVERDRAPESGSLKAHIEEGSDVSVGAGSVDFARLLAEAERPWWADGGVGGLGPADGGLAISEILVGDGGESSEGSRVSQGTSVAVPVADAGVAFDRDLVFEPVVVARPAGVPSGVAAGRPGGVSVDGGWGEQECGLDAGVGVDVVVDGSEFEWLVDDESDPELGLLNEVGSAVASVAELAVPEPAPVVEPDPDRAPVVEQTPVAQPAAVFEAAPVVEPAPAVEAAPIVEPAPAVEAAPIVEPVAETAPVVEAAPVVEPAPAVEAEPVVEPAPAVEAAPIVEPVAETTPVVEAAPVVEPAPVVETEPIIEHVIEPDQAPAVEEISVVETAPIVEPAIEQSPALEPVAETIPVVEASPAVETTPIIEPAPAPAVEPAPVAETVIELASAPTVEPAPAVEAEPVVEPAPVVETEPIIEHVIEPDPAPAVEEISVVETAPIVEQAATPARTIETAPDVENSNELEPDPTPLDEIPAPPSIPTTPQPEPLAETVEFLRYSKNPTLIGAPRTREQPQTPDDHHNDDTMTNVDTTSSPTVADPTPSPTITRPTASPEGTTFSADWASWAASRALRQAHHDRSELARRERIVAAMDHADTKERLAAELAAERAAERAKAATDELERRLHAWKQQPTNHHTPHTPAPLPDVPTGQRQQLIALDRLGLPRPILEHVSHGTSLRDALEGLNYHPSKIGPDDGIVAILGPRQLSRKWANALATTSHQPYPITIASVSRNADHEPGTTTIHTPHDLQQWRCQHGDDTRTRLVVIEVPSIDSHQAFVTAALKACQPRHIRLVTPAHDSQRTEQWLRAAPNAVLDIVHFNKARQPGHILELGAPIATIEGRQADANLCADLLWERTWR